MTKKEISKAVEMSMRIDRFNPADVDMMLDLYKDSKSTKKPIFCTLDLAALLIRAECKTLNNTFNHRRFNEIVPFLKKYVRVFGDLELF